MRSFALPFVVSIMSCAVAPAGTLPVDRPAPFGVEVGLFPYRLERGDLHYADTITLTRGAKHAGKVLEWANQILLFDAAGEVRAFVLPDVEVFETRRSDRHNAKPDLPDLTIAYVERLPRDPSWHGHVVRENGLERPDIDLPPDAWQPAAGARVTFRIHVLNAGARPSSAVPCQVRIDGDPIGNETIPALAPGTEHVLERAWSWQSGPHTLHVEIDPGGATPEIARWNNTFKEPTRALAVAVVVARDRYEAFRGTPNLVDTFCLEDFVQYHMRNLDALFAASVYPSAPEGILERVRCDRILVVENPSDPAAEQAWRPALHRGGQLEAPAEYAALLVLDRLTNEDDLRYDALKVDWRLLQQIGLQIGLVDLRRTDTTLQQCYVHDKFGRYVQRRHLSPWIRTLMYTPGGFPLAEHEAACLNHTLGRPRGFSGDYLYQLPANIVLHVLSNAGTPLEGVQVDGFQLMSDGPDAGRIIGVGRDDPLFSTTSDARGRAPLPNMPAPAHRTPGGYELRPNPFGKIATDGSNGLLLLRLRFGKAEEFHFLPLSVCNIACVRGHQDEYLHPVRTRFGPPDGPVAPLDASGIMEDRSTDRPPLILSWKVPKDYDYESLEEFRVYKRTSFAGEETKPWVLSSIVRRGVDGRWDRRTEETYFDEVSYDGPYGLDTFFAVSAVDKQGRESSLSEPAYFAYRRQCVQFAVQGLVGYLTLSGDGPAQLLYWDPVAGTQPYGLKPGPAVGYAPAFSGVAFTREKRIIVTDPVNHVLAIYDPDLHELVETIPRRDRWPGAPGDKPGEFSDPADVAVDDKGNLYVADRGNDRVQILDPRGRSKGLLDEDFRFKAPHAIAHANGRVCVTDKGGTRCRVYDVRGESPTLVCELPSLVDAGRALVNRSGKVFITGRASAEEDWGVLMYMPLGETVVFEGYRPPGLTSMGRFHRPRGLFLYPGANNEWAYMANDFPFDIRRINLEAK